MTVRIIERVGVDNKITFVIQQKHFIFFWWWVDAWVNSTNGASCTDSFNTLKEAKKYICYFDGSKIKERVISK